MPVHMRSILLLHLSVLRLHDSEKKQPNYINVILNTGVRTAQWYSAGLLTGRSGVRVPVRTGNFSPHHRVQTDCEAHPAFYPLGTGDSFPGSKAAGA
jgi:hypothetical protein